MLRAVEEARGRGGVGVWYPSPSEYDPMSFMASLSYDVAGAILKQCSPEDGGTRSRVRGAFVSAAALVALAFLSIFGEATGLSGQYRPWFVGASVFALAGMSLASVGRVRGARAAYVGAMLLCLVGFVMGASPAYLGGSVDYWLDGSPESVGFATGLAIAVLFAAALVARGGWRLRGALAVDPRVQLVRDASILRERVRYSSTRREGAEFGAEAGRGGLVGRFSRSREQELAERPLTLSGLIQDFRSLVAQAGLVTGMVVIAIDELDKISDPSRVRELLRDIKGIFEVPRVHFLVSVSHEAARALNLGAVLERDEFNSSFYTVIDLPPFDPWYCETLVKKRQPDGEEGVGLVLGVIAGGNPREVLRLADLASSQLCPQGWNMSEHALLTALRTEALSFRLDAISASTTNGFAALTEREKVGLFEALPERAFTPDGFGILAHHLLNTAWSAPWAETAWSERYEQEWQRLLVRMEAGSQLLFLHLDPFQEEGSENRAILLDLQRAIVMASHSAAVARLMLPQRAASRN
jgi:hypothetical protein